MALDLKKELVENDIILVVVPNAQYNLNIKLLAKQLNALNQQICYVNSNMIVDVVKELIKINGGESNFLIVDMVTKRVNLKPAQYDDVIYISGPRCLTEMCIAVNKILKTNKIELLFFDSVSALFIYRKQEDVISSIRDIISHLRKNKGKGIFMALEEDSKKGKLKNIESFVDKVVDVK